MKSQIVDKIASVAVHNNLGQEVRISSEILCKEGALLVVEVLNNKSRYNTLELISGRMARINKGDIIIGALGERKALFGYSGHMPEKVEVNDELQILNLGGVLGICDSVNPSVGEPFNCRVLGAVLEFPFLGERIGIPAIGRKKELPTNQAITETKIPIIGIAGTCMDAGKTVASCAVVSHFKHKGLVVNAFKATGVALRRDILAMEDAGAQKAEIFSDYGVMSTNHKNAPTIVRTLIEEMKTSKPDMIVFELGDGLLGEYGVEAILKDDDIKSQVSSWILCANDPVGAWGGVEILKNKFSINPDLVTGSATDNAVGIKIIENQLNVRGINALTNANELGLYIEKIIGA
ncbi:MAG: hypothetical protein ACO2ZB_02955 [Gammaproteobacteria bacterium]